MRIVILSFILFLSGISALLFETLWLRLSGLAFGNSVWAAALILSSFMTGLALGGAIAASRRGAGLRRPLLVYASLELVVAVLGCTIVFAIPALGLAFRPLFQMFWNHDEVLNALRLFVSFVILVLPTTAMGLTLPVLMSDPAARGTRFARALSLLYGCNTLGAVVGALLGEMYLVRAFGLRGTAFAAAGFNIAAVLLALLLAAFRFGSTQDSDREEPRPPPQHEGAARGRLLLVSFGAGLVLLSLEVVWFRFLRLYIASSSTAFAVMLAVVLAGIGIGGVLSSLFPRRIGQGRVVLYLLLTSAVVTPLCYVTFHISFLPRPDFYLDTPAEIAALSLWLMFAAALLSGMLFPAITSALARSVGNETKSTGLALLCNTTGAAIGPLLTTFVLLPSLGLQGSFILCVIAYLVLAIIISSRGSWSPRRPLGVFAWILVFASLVLTFIGARGREAGAFAHARQPFQRDGSELVRVVEGNSDTLQLLRRDLLGEPLYYRLLTDAFTMSDTRYQNQRYMRLFAYLPLILKPDSQSALLICFGCGMTADALLHDRDLQHIDVVDISKEVLGLAADFTGRAYGNPLRDPRVTTFVQDGRFFLQAAPRQYDVITGEPPPPKIAGTVNLYTEEFFRLMRSRLKEGGIATFWLPVNQLKVDEAKSILRAFHNAFPNASVWANGDYEWIMMGINGPAGRVDMDAVQRWWNDPGAHADFERIGIETPEEIPALFLLDARDIETLTADVPPLTDFYPKRLSDEPVDPAETDRFAMDLFNAARAQRRFRASALVGELWPGIGEKADPFLALRATRYASETRDTNKLAELDQYLRKSSLKTPILEVLGSDPLRKWVVDQVINDKPARAPEALPDLIPAALAKRDYARASELLEVKRAQGTADRFDLLLLSYVYCLSGNVEKAEQAAAALGPDRSDKLTDWLWGNLQAEFGFRPPS